MGHGVKITQIATSIATPVEANSGVPFVVGAAPVQSVGGKVNEPILAYTYAEAVTAFGMSDDWEKYPICEFIYSQFQLYGVSPVIFVNVLDPKEHKKHVDAAEYDVVDGTVKLPLEAIDSTVKAGPSGSEYKRGTDFELLYSGENLVLEVLEDGTIPAGTTKLNIVFDAVDPSAVTKSDIIGGFDVATKKSTGLELIDAVFPKYAINPDLIVCPGWSHDSEVAAIMGAKAQNINDVFEARALIDVDTTEVTYYSDVTAWKKKKNISTKYQVLCWPMLRLGDRVFHFSTQLAGLMAQVDRDNGDTPCESPSNKHLQIDSAVLADGTEILLDLRGANYLNDNGVVTALNWIGGYVAWGNKTACYPANTDVKDYFIPIGRMFAWVGNSLVLTYWTKVDKPMNRRLIDCVIDSVNIWLNGLTAEDRLLGGRVEFREEENPLTSLMAGKIKFHVFLTPPSPAEEIEFVLEYDVSYVKSALMAA